MPTDWCHKSCDGREAVVYFYGDIPPVAEAEAGFLALRDIRAKTVTIFVNTFGGDVFTGFALANQIRNWQVAGAHVTCEIAGVCGSAGALIAAAADETRMPADGFLHVHAAAYVDGRPADERTTEMNDAMARRFAAKTGRGKDQMLALMAGESWLNAEEAARLGFADAITGEMRVA